MDSPIFKVGDTVRGFSTENHGCEGVVVESTHTMVRVRLVGDWSIVGTPDEFKLVKAAPKPKVTLKINPPSELRLTCPLCRHEWGEPLSRIP